MTNLFSIYDHQETLLVLSNKTSKLRIYKSVGNNLKVSASLNGSNDDFFIPAEHLDKLLTYKSVNHAYKYTKRFELPNTKELFDAHIDNLIALDKAHKQSKSSEKPVSHPSTPPQLGAGVGSFLKSIPPARCLCCGSTLYSTQEILGDMCRDCAFEEAMFCLDRLRLFGV